MRDDDPSCGDSSSGGAGPISPLQKNPARAPAGSAACGRMGAASGAGVCGGERCTYKGYRCAGRVQGGCVPATHATHAGMQASRQRQPNPARRQAHRRHAALHPRLLVVPLALCHAGKEQAAGDGAGAGGEDLQGANDKGSKQGQGWVGRGHGAADCGGSYRRKTWRRLGQLARVYKRPALAQNPHVHTPDRPPTVWMLQNAAAVGAQQTR